MSTLTASGNEFKAIRVDKDNTICYRFSKVEKDMVISYELPVYNKEYDQFDHSFIYEGIAEDIGRIIGLGERHVSYSMKTIRVIGQDDSEYETLMPVVRKEVFNDSVKRLRRDMIEQGQCMNSRDIIVPMCNDLLDGMHRVLLLDYLMCNLNRNEIPYLLDSDTNSVTVYVDGYSGCVLSEMYLQGVPFDLYKTMVPKVVTSEIVGGVEILSYLKGKLAISPVEDIKSKIITIVESRTDILTDVVYRHMLRRELVDILIRRCYLSGLSEEDV